MGLDTSGKDGKILVQSEIKLSRDVSFNCVVFGPKGVIRFTDKEDGLCYQMYAKEIIHCATEEEAVKIFCSK